MAAKKKAVKNFIDLMDGAEFKKANFTIFNMAENEYFIHNMEMKHGKQINVDDLEYFMFDLNKVDQLLVKAKNQFIWNKINDLKTNMCNDENDMTVAHDPKTGNVFVIKYKA